MIEAIVTYFLNQSQTSHVYGVCVSFCNILEDHIFNFKEQKTYKKK